MQNEKKTSLLADKEMPLKRRSLLPWWIKIFCWIYMVVATGFIFDLLIYLFGGKEIKTVFSSVIVYAFTFGGFSVIVLVFLNGFAAWTLWTGKRFAITAAIIGAWLQIAACLVSMFILLFIKSGQKFIFRFELILLIPYLVKLHKIKNIWERSVVV